MRDTAFWESRLRPHESECTCPSIDPAGGINSSLPLCLVLLSSRRSFPPPATFPRGTEALILHNPLQGRAKRGHICYQRMGAWVKRDWRGGRGLVRDPGEGGDGSIVEGEGGVCASKERLAAYSGLPRLINAHLTSPPANLMHWTTTYANQG